MCTLLFRRKTLIVFWFATLLLMNAYSPAQADSPTPFRKGHIIAPIGNGQVRHYDANGDLLETILIGDSLEKSTGGCTFDASGNLYVVAFSIKTIKKISGPNLPHTVLGTFGSGYSGSPLSIVFAEDGSAYVGSVDGDNAVRKFDATGKPVYTYTVAVAGRGSNWIDLAKDQRTLFYTSEGHRVFRYDLLTNTQLPDFAQDLPGMQTEDLRILPNGEVLVTMVDFILRLDTTGHEVKRYDAADQDFWSSLSLDPDGTSFWAGDFRAGKISKFNIADGGDPLLTIEVVKNTNALHGICISESPIVLYLPKVINE